MLSPGTYIAILLITTSFFCNAQSLVLTKMDQEAKTRIVKTKEFKVKTKSGEKYRLEQPQITLTQLITAKDTIAISSISDITCQTKRPFLVNPGGYALSGLGVMLTLSGFVGLAWNETSKSSGFFPEESNGPAIGMIAGGIGMATAGYLISGSPRTFHLGKKWSISAIEISE
ncbi:MAG: hypothetical protein RIC35_22610 [Marinoscillum sp.]